MDKRKQLVFAILKYLDGEKHAGNLGDEKLETLEVALQCLEEVFDVKLANDLYNIPKPLNEMFEDSMKLNSSIDELPYVQNKEQAELEKAKGNDFMKSEKYQEAIQSYTKAILYDRSNPVYYSNRAAAYSKANLHDDALKDCDKALSIDPNYSKAYGRKGLALSSQNKFKEAVICYKKALELDPGNESYQQNLTIAETRAKDLSTSSGDPSNSAGGGAPFNIAQLLSNPAMMQMASQFMQNPEMQNLMQNIVQNQEVTDSNMPFDRLLNVGQQMAREIQEQNPDLVNQLRNRMNVKDENVKSKDLSSGNTNDNNPDSNDP